MLQLIPSSPLFLLLSLPRTCDTISQDTCFHCLYMSLAANKIPFLYLPLNCPSMEWYYNRLLSLRFLVHVGGESYWSKYRWRYWDSLELLGTVLTGVESSSVAPLLGDEGGSVGFPPVEDSTVVTQRPYIHGCMHKGQGFSGVDLAEEVLNAWIFEPQHLYLSKLNSELYRLETHLLWVTGSGVGGTQLTSKCHFPE